MDQHGGYAEAPALAPEGCTEDAPSATTSAVDADAVAWLTSGHEMLGKRVARLFGKACSLGTITKWVAADEAEGDPPLFHAEHDDGDEVRGIA